MRWLGSAAFALFLCGSCVLDDVELATKTCPCAEGWRCDELTNRCREGAPADGGARDGAADADAGSADAGVDASRPDAATADAGHALDGSLDGGALDGAVPVDAPPPDPTRCDDLHASAIFCDGFEDPGFAAWTSTYTDRGYIARATDRAFMGVGSAYAETTAAGGQVVVRSTAPGMVTTGDIYLRVWMYLKDDFATPAGFSLMQMGIDGPPYHHASVGRLSDGRGELYLAAEGGTATAYGAILPREEWVCLELHVRIHDTAGVAEYWMNGVHQARLDGRDSLPSGGYDRIVVGLPYTPSTLPEARVYVDEVVYDDAPIGCE